MRNLNFVFLSLFATIAFVISMSSCNKNDNIYTDMTEQAKVVEQPEEIDLEAALAFEHSESPLVKEISENTDFKAIIEYLNLRNADTQNFIAENHAEITNDPALLSDFIDSNTSYQEEIDNHFLSLHAALPAFNTLSPEDSRNIIFTALAQKESGNPVAARSCQSNCYNNFNPQLQQLSLMISQCHLPMWNYGTACQTFRDAHNSVSIALANCLHACYC